MAETPEDVLNAIVSLGSDPAAYPKNRLRAPTPGVTELLSLCRLLIGPTSEESFQKFFEQNIGFLTGMFGTNDNSDLAVLFKPPIGSHYRAGIGRQSRLRGVMRTNFSQCPMLALTFLRPYIPLPRSIASRVESFPLLIERALRDIVGKGSS